MAKKQSRKSSTLEKSFDRLWRDMAPHMPEPVKEFRFAVAAVELGVYSPALMTPTGKVRQWRFDRCWPGAKLAVEIDGGIFVGGGHNRGVQYSGDCEKSNAAVEIGWRILRFTTRDLERRPGPMIEQIARVLAEQVEKTGRLLMQKSLI